MIRFDAKHQLFQEYFVVCGTGNRLFNLFDDPILMDLCQLAIEDLRQQHGKILIVSGGAQGWDHYIAKVARQTESPLALVIPSPEFPNFYWGPRGSLDRRDHRDEWERLVDQAVEVFYVNSSFIGRNGRAGGSNFDRNVALAEIGQHFLVWNESARRGGTSHCVDLVRAAKIPFTVMNKERNNVLAMRKSSGSSNGGYNKAC